MGNRLPTSVPSMLTRLRGLRFTVDDTRTHYAVTHPDIPGQVTFAKTPSDWRWAKNTAADIFRTFGVDLRTSAR